jgi:DNA-binding GntR family transcriptional regulator
MAVHSKTRASGGSTNVYPKRDGQTDELIYQDMYKAIIDHRIQPGTALQEDLLASTFGVSRTVIRKVLQRLSHGHLVDLVPNRGAAVAKPSADEARQVFDARRILERVLIERLVANISSDGLDRLIGVVDAERTAFEAGNKHERLTLSGNFHRLLAHLAGNNVLAGFLNELISRTSLIIAVYEAPGAVPCLYGEHMQIVGALKRRDCKGTVELMEQHLRHVEAQIELSQSYDRVDFRSIFSPVR